MRPVLILTAAAICAAAPAALAAAPRDELATAARLQGNYMANGIVTKAVGVPGEKRGQPVTRAWQFTSVCPTGACATVQLVRQRATGSDKLQLHRVRPGYYKGRGSFPVAVRCGGRVYPAGELARYTITLTITTATTEAATAVATGFTATYRNPIRVGRTRCYSAPSYDTAHYVGSLTS